MSAKAVQTPRRSRFPFNFRLMTSAERRCGSANHFTHFLRRAIHHSNEPVARHRFANEGLVVLKPNSGSARHRWARENTKHPRTATRQRGFCRSSLEQLPPDLIQPPLPPENRPLEIVRTAASLTASA